MEGSARLFNPSNRHLANTLLLKTPHFSFHPRSRLIRPPPLPTYTIQSNPRCYTNNIYPSHPNPSPLLAFFQSLSASNYSLPPNVSCSEHKPFAWSFASLDGGDVKIAGDKGPIVTVVLLGWLGSKQKHLRRYAELYNSRGINAITFVASVKDVLSFDLGRRLQERISALSAELASWLSHTQRDGRQRYLLFHTFSNTGWLAYGAILADLQAKPDLLEKIKGSIFDSGADPHLNPKVWAAGFTAALLQKRSSLGESSIEAKEGNELESGGKEPPIIQVFFLLAFEKLFSFLLKLPEVNQRLSKILSLLSENQPHCPQLYLYSTGDKVIPFQAVESFIEGQRKLGRKVCSFNFGSSPHVDHYRTFPDMYSSQLQSFIKECLAVVEQS